MHIHLPYLLDSTHKFLHSLYLVGCQFHSLQKFQMKSSIMQVISHSNNYMYTFFHEIFVIKGLTQFSEYVSDSNGYSVCISIYLIHTWVWHVYMYNLVRMVGMMWECVTVKFWALNDSTCLTYAFSMGTFVWKVSQILICFLFLIYSSIRLH